MSKQVALILGSGGARGYAHIGVIEEFEARGYEITCITGCPMGSVIGGIYAADKLREYREWVESLDYLDVLHLLDISFRLGAIHGKWVFGKVHEILGEVNIEDLSIPCTTVAAGLTNQQEIWFQEGCLHQAMRASAAIPSLFTPVMQDSRVLADGGLLSPLPIVPVMSAHNDLTIAVNLNAANQKQYHLPMIKRPATFKGRLDSMIENLDHKLPFFRRHGDDNTPLKLSVDALFHPVPAESEGPTEPQLQQPTAAPQGKDSPKSASSIMMMESSGPASLLELVNQNFGMMQASLTQCKITNYLPDTLISVPKRVCRFFEFCKVPELITLGQQVVSDTLNRYKEGNAWASAAELEDLVVAAPSRE